MKKILYISIILSIALSIHVMQVHALSFPSNTEFLEFENKADCKEQGGVYIEWYESKYCTQSTPQVLFIDVSEDNVNFDAIKYLKEQKIVNGYQDGSYKAKSFIRRDEFLKIILEATFDKKEIESCNNSPFPDVHSYWAVNYVCLGKKEGVISGNTDGNYKPENNISFSEASKIISNAFAYEIEANENEWWEPFIMKLEEKKSIPTSISEIHSKLTRGEMAEIIYRLKSNISNKPFKTYSQLIQN